MIQKINEKPLLIRLILKAIHKLQKITVHWDNTNLYFLLSRLHFRIYFKKDLLKEMLLNSEEFKAAARRHGRLTIKAFFSDSDKEMKKKLYKCGKEAFRDNLTLMIEL